MIKRILTLSILLLSTASFAATLSPADLSLKTVVIDAGHGGKDPGTVSADRKTQEKTLTLKLARDFAARLREEYPGMKVVLTREKDEFIPLNDRAKLASNVEANLFISIHINASARSKGINGFSAYILGPSQKGNYDSYEVNMEACKRENSVIYLEDDYSTKYVGYDDSPESQILLQLMQNAFREQSLSFAETVSDNMDCGPFKKNWGVMQGNFAVLRQASMPAVLLEFGFMTNPEDLTRLRNETALSELIDNLFKAFSEYKRIYDQSVSIETSPDSAKTQKVTAKEAEVTSATADSSVVYGTQVLASAKLMDSSDPYFKGYDVMVIKCGGTYKYLLCPETNPQKAVEKSKLIRQKFSDSFFVRCSAGVVSRISPMQALLDN